EMTFMMYLLVDCKDCWVHGRMDASIAGTVPRVVDYKYATWHKDAEAEYEVQIMAYSLALMKALDTDRAIGELWYLKSPMKIIRCEYTRKETEERLGTLLRKYLAALDTGEWPAADRPYCDRVECGFRSQCWSAS